LSLVSQIRSPKYSTVNLGLQPELCDRRWSHSHRTENASLHYLVRWLSFLHFRIRWSLQQSSKNRVDKSNNVFKFTAHLLKTLEVG